MTDFNGVETVKDLPVGDNRAIATPVNEEPFDPDKSNLVRHARLELKIGGVPEEDQERLLKLVTEFASWGTSGGEASWYIHVLIRLLQFENLTELTDNPDEWNQVAEDTWQAVRNPEAFSRDGGKTYYLLSENKDPQRPDKTHTSMDHIRGNRG